jgi:hypothetical protein
MLISRRQTEFHQGPVTDIPRNLIAPAVYLATWRGFAGHSVTATLKLFQECSETFRDGLADRIVPGPKALPDFPQPWHLRQDVTTFGLARPTLPALAAKYPFLLRTSMEL